MPERTSLPRERHLPPELRTRAVADLLIMRAIVDFIGAWKDCLPRCRRHKCCESANVHCFDANVEEIRATLEALAAWRRLDGPRTPEEGAAPVRVLID